MSTHSIFQSRSAIGVLMGITMAALIAIYLVFVGNNSVSTPPAMPQYDPTATRHDPTLPPVVPATPMLQVKLSPPTIAQTIIEGLLPTDEASLTQAVAEYHHNCPTGLPSIDGSDFKLVKKLSQRKYHAVFMSFQESTRQMRVLRFLTRHSFVVREVRVAARMCGKCESAHYNLPVATVKQGHWDYEGSHFTTVVEGMVYPHLGYHKPMAEALAPLRAASTGALPPQLMHLVSKQLLQSVACMHAQGVMHRDLKQSNILATVEPLLLTIIDFGSAEMVKPAFDHSVLVGTMQYKPPELLLGLTRYDHFIDMWELGVTFANLLFDSPPRDGLFNPRRMVQSSQLLNMDDMVMRRRRHLGQTKQKHINMLEQISLFRGNDCVTANVVKYRPHLSPQTTKAFKSDAFDGVNTLIRKLENNEREGVEKIRQDAAKRFAALGDPVAIKLVGSMLVCDPDLRPSAYDSIQNLDKFLKEEKEK